MNVIGAGGTAPITGNGTHRSRTAPMTASSWTEWVDDFVRIDATVPQHDHPADDRLAEGAGQRRPDRHATPPRSCTWNGASAAAPGPPATRRPSPARARTSSRRRGRRGRQPHRAQRHREGRRHASGRHDRDARRLAERAVNVTVNGTDANSGVDRVEWQLNAQPIGAGPAGTVVNIGIHGQHTFRTRVIDEVGNASAWTDHPVWVDIQGPADTTVIPTGWLTTPSTVINITADDNGASGIKRIQWRLDGTTTGDVLGTDTTPVTVTGDGVHKLEVRITDNQDRVLDWHTHQVKIDTVNPVDNTTVAAGWLPLDYFDVLVRGTDAHSQVQGVEWRLDGGDIETASSNNYEVRVSGNGVHTLETRIVDNAGRRSAWKAHTVKLDAGLPDQHHADRARGLAQHALLGRAQRHRRRLRRRVGQLPDPARGPAGGCRARGHAQRHPGQPHPGRHAHAEHPRPRQRRQLLHVARRDGPHRPRAPDRRHVLSVGAPVGNRHIVTFDPQDDRSGAAGVEWKLDGGAVQTAPTATITGAGAHTLSVRVQDNAGNWSAWADHTITVVSSASTRPPRPTPPSSRRPGGSGPPRHRHRRGRHRRHRRRLRPVALRRRHATGRARAAASSRSPRTASTRSRRARSTTPATPRRGAGRRCGSTRTPPTDTSAIADGLDELAHVHVSATDATSGVADIEYKIDNAAPVQVAGTTTVTLPADGDYRVRHRAIDNAGQISAWTTHEFKRRHGRARRTRARRAPTRGRRARSRSR